MINQLTLDNKNSRYYTDIIYKTTMDIIEGMGYRYEDPRLNFKLWPKECEGAKIRIGRQFSVNDLKKGIVKQYSFVNWDDNPSSIHTDFGWCKPNHAKEISKLLNQRGFDTIILDGQGGTGISGIHTVITVEELEVK